MPNELQEGHLPGIVEGIVPVGTGYWCRREWRVRMNDLDSGKETSLKRDQSEPNQVKGTALLPANFGLYLRGNLYLCNNRAIWAHRIHVFFF